jgi:hypothetical protein
MKTLGCITGLMLAAATVAFAAGQSDVVRTFRSAGAEQTWTGKIGDSACNLKHESGQENVPPPPDKECTLNCVRGGSEFVLLVSGKIFKLANQKDPALTTLAGDNVKVTGELKGDVITASKIEKAQ